MSPVGGSPNKLTEHRINIPGINSVAKKVKYEMNQNRREEKNLKRIKKSVPIIINAFDVFDHTYE